MILGTELAAARDVGLDASGLAAISATIILALLLSVERRTLFGLSLFILHTVLHARILLVLVAMRHKSPIFSNLVARTAFVAFIHCLQWGICLLCKCILLCALCLRLLLLRLDVGIIRVLSRHIVVSTCGSLLLLLLLQGIEALFLFDFAIFDLQNHRSPIASRHIFFTRVLAGFFGLAMLISRLNVIAERLLLHDAHGIQILVAVVAVSNVSSIHER
mmetsp:Transcript_93502/g.150967  ORF Transcript_93502/g.150967 Transcript_93502/m.150967 type:complete len:218 (-) Transcript_93502:18-671(-)